MRVLRSTEGETVDRTGSPIFQGTVHGRGLADGLSDQINAAVVHFSPALLMHDPTKIVLTLPGTGADVVVQPRNRAQSSRIRATWPVTRIPVLRKHDIECLRSKNVFMDSIGRFE